MKSFSELKTAAKAQIKGKIVLLFAMTLVMYICTALVAFAPIVGTIANYIVSSAFGLGFTFVLLKIAKCEALAFENMFYGFTDLWTAIKAQFFMGLFISLWMLLLIIPGWIKTYSYSQTFFILAENKGMPVLQAITLSRKMMDGHKMELFLLHLSFIGWLLLVMITFGIASIWVLPYMWTTVTNFYLSVKKDFEARNGGVITA